MWSLREAVDWWWSVPGELRHSIRVVVTLVAVGGALLVLSLWREDHE